MCCVTQCTPGAKTWGFPPWLKDVCHKRLRKESRLIAVHVSDNRGSNRALDSAMPVFMPQPPTPEPPGLDLDLSQFDPQQRPAVRSGHAPKPDVLPHPGRVQVHPPHLTRAAHIWLAAVPPRYQPLATARRYPHIVNKLAAVWDVPHELAAYLKELMISSRPGRSGFSFDVLTELSDLQDLVGKGR